MSNVNLSNQLASYYNLNQSANGKDKTQSSNGTGVSGLLDALNNVSGSKQNAYNLDLSPEAQKYLQNSSPVTSSSTKSGFTLSAKQRETIDSILSNYKDAPYTQETFKKIQEDLSAAGLSPEKLSLENHVKNFNATNVLLAALSGKDVMANANAQSIQESEQDNANAYMKQILSSWKAISTTTAATEEPSA